MVEDAALAWLEGLGYKVRHGPDIALGEPDAERTDPDYRDVVLEGRLRHALATLNTGLPPGAIEDAFRKLRHINAPSLVEKNRAVHRMIVEGITVEYRREDGSIAGEQARVIDFDIPDSNDWLAVNQFTMSEGQHTRRPDVVFFVNGLPLGVIELKNPADENATVWSAFQQLQTYQAQIPELFVANAALVASDGVQARIGSLGAGKEWFKPWRTITGRRDAPAALSELQVVLEGVFEKRRFLDLLRYFIVFEDSAVDGGDGKLIKKMAGYHQFHAVNVAVEQTLRAAERPPSLRLVSNPAERFQTTVPLVPLRAAAGAFGDPHGFRPDDFDWIGVKSGRRLQPGMFVAQVVGQSMMPQIPDGSWCLFRSPVEGTRQGKIVLVELRDAVDPETGQRYTVKRYESTKVGEGDSWRHERITLRPLNPEFQPKTG